jgi:hypothetical protein
VSDTEGGDNDLGIEDSADYDRGCHRAKLADKVHVAAEREEPGGDARPVDYRIPRSRSRSN